MTDELTTDLATISALRVTSRGSTMQFAGKNRPSSPEIAKALNVDAIVEGSVTRSGDKVRITAQLIDAAPTSISGHRVSSANRATCSPSRRSLPRPSPRRSTRN